MNRHLRAQQRSTDHPNCGYRTTAPFPHIFALASPSFLPRHLLSRLLFLQLMNHQDIYQFHANDITGTRVDMASFKDRVLLIVNTASACGLTPQLEGLQALHTQFAEQGLTILGFPCNQFARQDPKSNDEIAQFCQRNYGVNFTMMEKINVNGKDAHPLFQWLREQLPGSLGTTSIKWNFTKFLLARDGTPVKRFAPKTSPEKIITDIQALL